ncbi:ABC transporter substrate-binding protein [Paenibacillus taichungensis]
MKATRKLGTLTLMITLIGALLSACGSQAEPSTTTAEAKSGESTTSTQAESGQSETKSYTDSLGHTVEIPVNAKRIIFTGSDLGDLLALDVKPVGAALGIIGDQIAYPELLDGIEDVGDLQGDLEKITSLSPDLILLDAGGSYYEENQYTLLSKIAPTVTYDRLSTNERVKVFGDILGKEQAAEDWIETYAEQFEQVRNQLDLPTGVTASVFLQLPHPSFSSLAKTCT